MANQVRALTRELERQRGRANEAVKQAEKATDAADAATRAATKLAQAVEALRTSAPPAKAAVTDLPRPEPTRTVSWWEIDDQEHARTVVGGLLTWMEAVYLQYPEADKIPSCWTFHPWVIAELLGLRDAWHAANAEDAAPVALLDWHDRWRPNTVKRINELECHLTNHQSGGSRAWAPPQLPGADMAFDLAIWWAETHGSKDQPAPTRDMIEAEASRRAGKSQDRY